MKTPSRRIAILLAGFCLAAIAFAVSLFRGDPYDRLERMARNAARLESKFPRPYRLSDHILVGVLRRREPMRYYEEEAQKAQKALLASGHLIQTNIPFLPNRPEGEIHKSLYAVFQRTGAYYSAEVNQTNGSVLLVCKPKDLEEFAAALK